jgi:hypothetical protein
MSNYSKLTNFASKDSLASGNPLKVIKGTEIDDEFEAIETSVGTKADLASPTFTGTPAAPTASSGTNSTQIATTAFVTSAVSTAIDNGTNNASASILVDNVKLNDLYFDQATTGWKVTQDGSNNLVFSFNGTNKMKVDSSGNLTVVGDITAYGTI